MVSKLLLLLISYLIVPYSIWGLYYHSIAKMRDLLDVEHVFADKFFDYLDAEEKRLQNLENFVKEVEGVVRDSSKNEALFVSNPANVYLLFKRFVENWPNTKELYGKNKNTSLTPMNGILRGLEIVKDFLPDQLELRGTVLSLIKLQHMYQVSPAEFSDGFGNAPELGYEDMFEIGARAERLLYFPESFSWFEELLKRWPRGNDTKVIGKTSLGLNISRFETLNYISYVAYEIGNLEAAELYGREAVHVSPTEQMVYNYRWYVYDLHRSVTNPSVRKKFRRIRESLSPFLDRYDSLCREEEQMPQHVKNRLLCYFSTPHPRFTITPLKVEVIYDGDPYVVAYRHFVGDKEVDRIIELTKPYLKRAQAYNPETGKPEDVDYRIAGNAWISGAKHPVVNNFVIRVGDAVNLNMFTAEPLQMGNYGIAGNYDPHCDHVRLVNSSAFGIYGKWGNRMSTALVYFSDVERGGQTVFVNTEKGVIMRPEKGTFLFWHNLYRNGTGNNRTEHAACPVLLGEKWIANLWIHERGQEFTRPCDLENDF